MQRYYILQIFTTKTQKYNFNGDEQYFFYNLNPLFFLGSSVFRNPSCNFVCVLQNKSCHCI